MAAEECRIVLAGDVLDELSNPGDETKIILGPGLRRESDKVVAIKCGMVKKKGQSTYWIDNHQKRYVPARGECVLGIVTAKAGDTFRVDIGGSEQATLSFLAFEGATKRNRPNVQVGDVVYAKLLVANKDMEPELVCVDRHGKSSGFGIPDEGGFLFDISLNLSRKLLLPSCPLFKCLGDRFRFESVIGMNGRVWVKGRNVKETVVLSNAIALAENMTEEEMEFMSKKLAEGYTGF